MWVSCLSRRILRQTVNIQASQIDRMCVRQMKLICNLFICEFDTFQPPHTQKKNLCKHDLQAWAGWVKRTQHPNQAHRKSNTLHDGWIEYHLVRPTLLPSFLLSSVSLSERMLEVACMRLVELPRFHPRRTMSRAVNKLFAQGTFTFSLPLLLNAWKFTACIQFTVETHFSSLLSPSCTSKMLHHNHGFKASTSLSVASTFFVAFCVLKIYYICHIFHLGNSEFNMIFHERMEREGRWGEASTITKLLRGNKFAQLLRFCCCCAPDFPARRRFRFVSCVTVFMMNIKLGNMQLRQWNNVYIWEYVWKFCEIHGTRGVSGSACEWFVPLLKSFVVSARRFETLNWLLAPAKSSIFVLLWILSHESTKSFSLLMLYVWLNLKNIKT